MRRKSKRQEKVNKRRDPLVPAMRAMSIFRPKVIPNKKRKLINKGFREYE